MTTKAVKKMSKAELKKEHRNLQGKLKVVNKDLQTALKDSVIRIKRDKKQIDKMEGEVTKIRKRQKKLYREHQSR